MYNNGSKNYRAMEFVESWLPLIEEETDVGTPNNYTYEFEVEPFGRVQYFPKANKIHICESNKWNFSGLNWIIKNVLTK